jgi:hypothetical protein
MLYIIDTELGTVTPVEPPVPPVTGTIEAAVDALTKCYNLQDLVTILRRLAQAVAALEIGTRPPVFKWTGPPAMPTYPSIPSPAMPLFMPYIGDSNPLYPWTVTCQSQNPPSGFNSTPQADGDGTPGDTECPF